MAKFYEVLNYLASDKQFYSYGETYEDIVWEDGIPSFTKEEFLNAFEELDNIKLQKKIEVEQKLNALGLTLEDIKAALE
jgi:hypothetical protein